MKNYILIFLVFPVLVKGQMFEAHLVISDASGNSDTIIIGRDQDASSKIDAIFDEVDITTTPWTNTLEARVGVIDQFELWCGENEETFQPNLVRLLSKKNIYTRDFEWDENIAILLHAPSYPITISWDPTLFQVNPIKGSIITDWHPGLWFDTQCATLDQPYYSFHSSSSLTLEKPTAVTYLTSENIRLDMLFFTLFPEDISVSTDNEEYLELALFPNPTNSRLVTLEFDDEENRHIKIINSSGKIIQEISSHDANQLVQLPNQAGLYYIEIKNQLGIISRSKIIRL